jgi:hypothetical protein
VFDGEKVIMEERFARPLPSRSQYQKYPEGPPISTNALQVAAGEILVKSCNVVVVSAVGVFPIERAWIT